MNPATWSFPSTMEHTNQVSSTLLAHHQQASAYLQEPQQQQQQQEDTNRLLQLGAAQERQRKDDAYFHHNLGQNHQQQKSENQDEQLQEQKPKCISIYIADRPTSNIYQSSSSGSLPMQPSEEEESSKSPAFLEEIVEEDFSMNWEGEYTGGEEEDEEDTGEEEEGTTGCFWEEDSVRSQAGEEEATSGLLSKMVLPSFVEFFQAKNGMLSREIESCQTDLMRICSGAEDEDSSQPSGQISESATSMHVDNSASSILPTR